eukprot:bmy_16268T0
MELLEMVLSHVPPHVLLGHCRRVCRCWRDLVDCQDVRLSILARDRAALSPVLHTYLPPADDLRPCILGCFCERGPIERNLLRNPKGLEGFRDWTMQSSGDGWGEEENLELLERLQNGHIGQYGAAEEAIGISGEVPGTAENARSCVRAYFSDLHETLCRQEEMALSVVDAHVREKLIWLRQQQEDMTILLSQVSTACLHCEKTLQQDDCRVVLAKQEITRLLETLQKQQQQFTEVADHIQLDASIPVTFTKDNRVHIGPKMEIRVVTLGLDGAGKTTILFKLKQDEFMQPIPTIGFNVETVEYKNLKFTIWDVGGKHKLRPLWKHYYLNTQAVVFVVDSSHRDRVSEAHSELAKLLTEKELRDALLLIFANKQDVAGALSVEEITELLSLHKLCCGRSWYIQGCDARSGMGLYEGLDWLSRQLVAAGVLDVA